MLAVLHADLVAQQRRHGNPQRKDEVLGFLAALQRGEGDLSGLARHRVVGGVADDVVLDDVVGIRESAVDELGLTGNLHNGLHLRGSEQIVYLEEHGRCVMSSSSGAV